MRQLLDLAREHALLRQELDRLAGEMTAIQRALVAGPRGGRARVAPRMVHIVPEGGGRYIAVDRDGELWRGETKRGKEPEEEYIQWKPLPSEFPAGR